MTKEEGDDDRPAGDRGRHCQARRTSRRSSSAGCSTTRPTRATASSTSRPAPAAPRPATGPACCCASTCKYAERKGFKTEVMEETEGDMAGIKSATIKVEGDYAFGLLRTETGVHRLVRKCPFDSSGGRHTSFASVFVYPGGRRLDRDRHQPGRRAHRHLSRQRRRRPAHQQDRLGGAPDAHPDRHRGAVPGRPHASTATATWPGRCLRSRLYDHEMRKRMEEQQKLEDTKTDVGWGHQIRSYVLDQSRIKDLRTGVEISQHPEGAGRRPRRFHRSQPEARRLTPTADQRQGPNHSCVKAKPP